MPEILFAKPARRVFVSMLLAICLIAFCTASLSADESEPHLYFFTSDGCAPCRQVEPAIEALGHEGYPVTTINTNASPEWVRRFQIDRTPTVVLVANNKMVGRHAGLIDGVSLKRWFAAVGMKSGTTFTDKKGKAIPGGTKVVMSAEPNRSKFGGESGSRFSKVSTISDSPDSFRETPKSDGSPLPGSSESFSSSTMHEGTRVPANEAEKRAMNATVLLRVEDTEGISYATGTVIHSRDGESLVLTCGHVFRDAAGNGKITAEYGYGNGTAQTKRGSGELIYYDADARDIGLVAIRTEVNIQPVQVASTMSIIQKGLDVFSIGCDHGEKPTIRRTRIKNKAAYDGSIKYDIFGRPVDGRSGGGLFSKNGALIGVCNAAAVEVDEGIYAALDTIYWQLETVNLRHLFGSPVEPTRVADNRAFENQVAAIRPETSRGQSSRPMQPLKRNPAVLSQRQRDGSSERTRVSWDQSQTKSNDREVIIIVRSKTNPANTDAISIDNPTPELLNYLDSMQSASTETRRMDVAQLRMQNIRRVAPVKR